MNDLLFYIPAALLVLSALNIAISSHPVRSVLSLMLAFISTSVLWLALGAEFLALALIFIYVGAVMALFLFIVFMLNVDRLPRKALSMQQALALITLLVAVSVIIIKYLGTASYAINPQPIVEQTKQLGLALFQDYWVGFEVMGFLLLASMIGAIVLVLAPTVGREK